MFVITESNRRFEWAGLSILALQMLLFVFGLPPFQAGIWYQTEPTMVALYVLAVANVAWLGIGYFHRWLQIERPHLLWICLLLWIGWQWVASLLAVSFWRSWFGPVEIGEGAGWYTAMLFCSMLCAPFWQNDAYRRKILYFAVAAILIICAMHVANGNDPDDIMPWRPARWPDYLAFVAIWFWIAVMASGYGKKIELVCLMILFTYAILYVANNMTGTAFATLAMLVTTVMPYPALKRRFKKFITPNRYWRRLAIVACFLPCIWVAFSAGAPYLSLEKRGTFLKTMVDNEDSLGARVLLNRIALATLAHEPERMIYSAGWGNYTNDSYQFAMAEGVRAFENGIPKPNARHVTGSAFHSHTEPLEILLSLGWPGVLLWFAFPIIVIRKLPNVLFWQIVPMLVAVYCLYYFWFALPQVIAYQALAITALCAALAPPEAQRQLLQNRRIYLTVIEFAFLLMCWSAYSQYQALRYSEEILTVPHDEMADIQHIDWLKEDIKRDGDRLRIGGENFFLWAWSVDYKGKKEDYHPAWHTNFMEAAQAMANDPSVGPRNQMLLLWMQQKLLLDYTGERHDYLRTKATRGIRDSIMLLTKVAPLREDLAAVFLMNLSAYTHGNIAKQKDILMDILKIYPDHRSALWLLGQIYLTEPNHRQEGEKMIRQAVETGVDRIYPITNEELGPWLSK